MFDRDPFTPETPDDGDVGDAIERAVLLIVAVFFAAFVYVMGSQ